MKKFVLTAVLVGFTGISVFNGPKAVAAPARIVAFRHGEKTDAKKDVNLSPQGYQRAAQLASDFPASAHIEMVGGLASEVFAMGITPGDSQRPIETVQPLARAKKLKINHRFTRTQGDELLDYMMSDKNLDGKTVFICWEHNALQGIVQSLGVTDLPEWPEEDYSRVYVIDLPKDYSLENPKIAKFEMTTEGLPMDADAETSAQ